MSLKVPECGDKLRDRRWSARCTRSGSSSSRRSRASARRSTGPRPWSSWAARSSTTTLAIETLNFHPEIRKRHRAGQEARRRNIRALNGRRHDHERDEASAIQTKLYEFMDVLRDASVNISTDEVLSLFNALRHVSLLRPRALQADPETTLVKDYTDIPVFDRCFDEFFAMKSGENGFDVRTPSGDERPRRRLGERAPGMDEARKDSLLKRSIADSSTGPPGRRILGQDPRGDHEASSSTSSAVGLGRGGTGHDPVQRAVPVIRGRDGQRT